MNFNEIVNLAKTDENQAVEELKKIPTLSQEEIDILKQILSKYWIDNPTKEEEHQMLFAAKSLLGRNNASLNAADYAAIEIINSSEFFYEVYPEARPVETS